MSSQPTNPFSLFTLILEIGFYPWKKTRQSEFFFFLLFALNSGIIIFKSSRTKRRKRICYPLPTGNKLHLLFSLVNFKGPSILILHTSTQCFSSLGAAADWQSVSVRTRNIQSLFLKTTILKTLSFRTAVQFGTSSYFPLSLSLLSMQRNKPFLFKWVTAAVTASSALQSAAFLLLNFGRTKCWQNKKWTTARRQEASKHHMFLLCVSLLFTLAELPIVRKMKQGI